MFITTGIQSIDNLNLILETVESMNCKRKWKGKEFDLFKVPKREHPTKTAVGQNLKKARVHYGVHLLHNRLSDLSYCDIAGQSHLNTNSQTLPFGKGVVLPKMSTGKYCKRKTLLITQLVILTSLTWGVRRQSLKKSMTKGWTVIFLVMMFMHW